MNGAEPGPVLLAVWVPGHPRTKGSKTVRRGLVVERETTIRWQAVAAAAIKRALPAGWQPIPKPLHVGGRLTLHLPFDDVTTHAAGDMDKHERLAFDALTTAGYWQDDAQANGWGPMWKTTANVTDGPGLAIVSWVWHYPSTR